MYNITYIHNKSAKKLKAIIVFGEKRQNRLALTECLTWLIIAKNHL